MSHVPTILKSGRSVFEESYQSDDNEANPLFYSNRDLVDADQTMATQVTETILQALRALFQASLRSTHCHLADILMKCRTPSIEQHLQVNIIGNPI